MDRRWLVRACGCLVLVGLYRGCDAIDSSDGDGGRAPAVDAGGSSAPLPAAFKGYELYAWDEDGALSFTLITGTNRLKTVDEIVAPEANAESGEWIVVHGQGREALERTLARVPAGTSVLLSALEGLPSLSAAGRAVVDQALAAADR